MQASGYDPGSQGGRGEFDQARGRGKNVRTGRKAQFRRKLQPVAQPIRPPGGDLSLGFVETVEKIEPAEDSIRVSRIVPGPPVEVVAIGTVVDTEVGIPEECLVGVDSGGFSPYFQGIPVAGIVVENYPGIV